MADQTISRGNLGEAVYRVLWERILDRRLEPGEKLSDLQLSRELGVSRTPVREALHRLVQEGVVHTAPNRGFYVALFEPRDVAEIYEVRATLEGMALGLAAPRLAVDELEEALAGLASVERELALATDDDAKETADRRFLNVDQGFHRLIVERAENRRLMVIIESLWGQISVFQRTGARKGWWDIAIADHRAIIDALLSQKHDDAVNALTHHILKVKCLVLSDLVSS